MPKAKAGETIEAVYEEIGRRIRWVRESKKKKAKDMAAAVSSHQTTVSGWELGALRIRVAELVLVCDYLGVKPSVLIDGLPLEQCRPTERQRAQREARGELLRRRAAQTIAKKRRPEGQKKKAAAKKKGARP